MSEPTGARSISHAGALALIAAFVVLQSLTLDYGTRINKLPFIRDYRITSDVVRGSALERTAVIGSEAGRVETLDRTMLRFKLYTTDADEVDNVMAQYRLPTDFTKPTDSRRVRAWLGLPFSRTRRLAA